MPLPAIFGNTWEDFVVNWCLNNAQAEDQKVVEKALTALLRIWPEKEADVAAVRTRGLLDVVPLIEAGLILSCCERLRGFEDVLRRLKTGERSAYVELRFAARLVKAGFEPVLEPPLGDGLLDTAVPTSDGEVFCEVIAPETSAAIEEIRAVAARLATILKEENTGRRVEVLLRVDLDESVSNRLVEALRVRPDSDEIWAFGETALISKKMMSDGNAGPTIPAEPAAAIIGVAQASFDRGVRSAGIVRVPVTDARAKRLLYGESHHFSRDRMNILVMDVSKIVSNFTIWAELILKCFQPDQNRRFGAVVLFWTGITGQKLSTIEEWKVVTNPYAYRPIPESLVAKILQPIA